MVFGDEIGKGGECTFFLTCRTSPLPFFMRVAGTECTLLASVNEGLCYDMQPYGKLFCGLYEQTGQGS